MLRVRANEQNGFYLRYRQVWMSKVLLERVARTSAALLDCSVRTLLLLLPAPHEMSIIQSVNFVWLT
ncbi:hypothetical protein GDO78_002804 [Eleutherodactylus coqui]|uniref:Uncharacterized protein n=1 Tax=Eleutherodactylus coqui TaxID=57060 RepID=A0A8J6K2W7_ELECQ|nr:hypothetical protein GDO78_002804 [Eleutherodactylus coqui]